MLDDRTYCIGDDVLCPHWSETKTCHASDKSDYSNTLIPCSIVKFEELRISNLLKQYLTNYTENVDSSDND